MKTFIRILLCLGSLCIILSNWPNLTVALLGGVFFFLANLLSLIYNIKKRRIEPPTTKRMRSLI